MTKYPRSHGVDGAGQEQAGLFAALAQACSDAVITVTEGGIVTSWNAAAEGMFGVAAADAIGQPAERLVPALIKPGAPGVTVLPVADTQGLLTGKLLMVRESAADSAQRLRDASEINHIYRSAIENLSDCINVKDLSGRFLIANEATADLMQAASAADLIGKTDFDFYPRSVAEAFLEDERRILEEGVPRVIEQEAFRRDGRRIMLSTLKVPLRDEAGRATGLITLNRDITQKRMLEWQLAQSQEHLADALAYMPDGLAMFDDKGVLVFSNRQFSSLFPSASEVCVPGRTLQDILLTALGQGGFRVPPAALTWNFAKTPAELLQGLESAEYQLGDGRWIESRAKRTAGGGCLLVSIDVTARKEAAKALEESEERYRLVAEITLEAWWEESLSQGTVRHSRRFCEMLGLGDDMLECAIELFLEHIHPEDQAKVETAYQHTMRENVDYRAEYRLRHTDGHYIWVEDHGRLVAWNADGSPARLLGAMTDITARKQAEMALQKSEQRYRQLAEITQEAWWEEDVAAGTYTNSPRFCEMLGLGADILSCPAQVYRELIHPDDRPRSGAAHARAKRENTDYREIYRLRHADGRYIWVEDYGRVIARDADGNPTRMLGATIDITARKQAEIDLQESEENFRELFDDAPDAYVIIDPDNGRILACNHAAARMLRGTREEIAGLTPDDLSPTFQPDGRRSAEAAPEKIRNIIEKGYHRFEWMHRRLDGSDFWAEVTTTVGTFRHRRALYGIWREIGEIIAAKQAAEAASTAKSQFLSVMSHELRTPLTAIMGMFQLIGLAGVSDKAREYVARGLNSSEHLLKIVEDILDFSSIESGRLTVVRLPFRMATLIDEVANVAAAMQKPDVVFEVQADEQLRHLDVLGDMLRLKQVLINFVGNALKFTDRGSVVLSVSRAGGTDETPLLEFAVTDTGIGLAPDQQSRLFQPFTQVDMSNARRFSGTGLGLVISQRLVSLMGGEPIQVESKAGEGSRFAFRMALPLASAIPTHGIDPGAVSVPTSEGRLAGLRVLVVEDSATVRFALRLLLQSEGAIVEEADDGAVAVKLALSTSQPFDALLMDMQMPVQDGLAATRDLRARGYSRAIVALTANAFARDTQACLAAGMNDYVAKPVKLNDLVAVLLRNCKGVVQTA